MTFLLLFYSPSFTDGFAAQDTSHRTGVIAFAQLTGKGPLQKENHQRTFPCIKPQPGILSVICKSHKVNQENPSCLQFSSMNTLAQVAFGKQMAISSTASYSFLPSYFHLQSFSHPSEKISKEKPQFTVLLRTCMLRAFPHKRLTARYNPSCVN